MSCPTYFINHVTATGKTLTLQWRISHLEKCVRVKLSIFSYRESVLRFVQYFLNKCKMWPLITRQEIVLSTVLISWRYYVESLEISAASWISYTRTHPREHLLRKWQTVFFPPYIAIRTFNEKILWLKLTLQFFFPYNCTIILSNSICMYSKNAVLCL